MSKNITPEEVESFLWQFKLLIGGLVALFVVPLLLYIFYLDSRLGSLENSLRYKPPEESETEETGMENGTDPTPLSHSVANPFSGQVVYVPAYSHIYHGDGDPYLLTITLSVRNTSTTHEIMVKSVRYFDTKGKEVKSYLKKPVRLSPLGSTEVLVERDDASGGSGANFLVEWYAKTPVSEPIIEAVMIDTNSQQGISFARSGSVISVASPNLSSSTEDGTHKETPANNGSTE